MAKGGPTGKEGEAIAVGLGPYAIQSEHQGGSAQHRPQHTENKDINAALAAVVESLPSALVVFDASFRVILRNQHASNLLPESRDVRETLAGIVLGGEYPGWEATLSEVLREGEPRQIVAPLRAGRDQPDMFVNVTISPLRYESSPKPSGGLLLIEDVTSRISMERRLAVSERLAAVGKLAARVAHELSNPLDGIMRFANLAKRRAAESGDEKAVEYLEKAGAGLARMAQITSSLLEFSRSTYTDFEQATINKILEDAVSAMGGRAQERRVTVVCNLHEQDMPVVRGSSLFQVFCNLVKNAIDAHANMDGGTVTVTSRIEGPDVVVVIEDTGVGLPDEIDDIFEPFFTTKPPGEGTGLGLAVCKDIVERYSGTITAANRAGGGAVMTVHIPVRNCGAPPARRRGSGGKPI